ncbi:PLxRFG domain-containing protein [Fundidesulfovibrio butyratiphilus]
MNSFIDEQTKDTQGVQGRLSPQEQSQEVVPGFTVPFTDFKVPSITGKDILSGVGNLGYSAPSMIAGLGAGALASESGPGAIAAASATAGAVGGVIGYRATKDQFVQEATEHFLKQRPKSSEQDVLSFQKSIEPLATEYGLWEAGPEAVSQAVTAGLIKLPVADMLSKVFPALKAAGPVMKANIMGKVASGAIKTGADLGEELTTETITQKNQGRIESEMGMRDKAPTWGESFQEVYPQVVPMVGVTMGAGGLHNMALERARAKRQAADDAPKPEATDLAREATAGIDSVVNELKGEPVPQTPPAPFQGVDAHDPVWNLRQIDLSARQVPGQPKISDYFNPATEQALAMLREGSTDQAPFAPVGEGMPLWDVRRITPENGDLSSLVAPSPLDQALEKIRAMNAAQERDRFNANLPATDHERALAPVEEASTHDPSGLAQLQLPSAPARQGLPYGGQVAPDNARRDLPVPGTAIPMEGRVDVGEMPPSERLAPSLPDVDRLQALADASKTTPRAVEEPQPSPVTVRPESPPAADGLDGLIMDKSGKPFKDKTINLAVAQSIKRGRNVEAVQIGPNRWGMRPVEYLHGKGEDSVVRKTQQEDGDAQRNPDSVGRGLGEPGSPDGLAPHLEDTGRRLRGGRTEIAHSEGRDVGRYEIREADDLIPSHDANRGFIKHNAYPENVQERPYHRDRAEQQKVTRNAAQLEPAYVVNDNPDAINGPPIVTEDGVVLGGNSRAMSIQMAYLDHAKNADAYRRSIEEKAERFGLKPEDVAAMKRPVLVRVAEGQMDEKTQARKARLYNQTAMQALDPKAEGVSKARMVTNETMGTAARGMGMFDTLRQYLGDRASRDLVVSLERDGIIETARRNILVHERSGLLTDDGKKLVENVLRGAVLEDFDLIANLPDGVRNKLDRSLPSLFRIKMLGGRWDIVPDVRQAVRRYAEFVGSGKKYLEDFLGQGSLLSDKEDSNSVKALLNALEYSKPTVMAEMFGRYASQAESSAKHEGQSVLPGMAETVANPVATYKSLELDLLKSAGVKIPEAPHLSASNAEVTSGEQEGGHPEAGRIDLPLGEKIGGSRKGQEQTKEERPQYSRRDKRAYDFVEAPWGGNKFGEISAPTAKRMGSLPGEIRLQRGWHDPKTDKGFGEVHIWEGHQNKIKAIGFQNARDFVADLLSQWEELHIAKGARESGKPVNKWAAIIRGEDSRLAVLEFRREAGGFYTVTSAYTKSARSLGSQFTSSSLLVRRPRATSSSGQSGPPVYQRLSSASGKTAQSALGVRSDLGADISTNRDPRKGNVISLREAQGLLERSGLSPLAEAYESLEMMPKAVQDVLHATNGEEEPAFFHGGKLYFNLAHTQDRADLARSIAHEIIHPGEGAFARKLGLRMGVREAQISLNNIKDRIFHDYRKEIQTLLTEYGYNQDYDIRTLEGRRGIVGELLATRSETFAPRWYDKVAALVARIVNGVRAKMGLGPMRFAEAEMRELIGGIRAAFAEEQGGMVAGAGKMAPAFMRQSEAKEWARQLDEFAAGRAIPGKPLTVGTTPKVLRLLGADKLPMTMNSDKIARITGKDHNILLETLKDLPRALADPYMVFDSNSQTDSLTVLTDLLEDKKPILAAIHLNTREGRVSVNRVASAYGKDNLVGFLRKQELERTIRYVNKRKTSEGQRSRRLQLPKEMTFRGREKVFTERDLGNPFDEEISGPKHPLFRRAAQVVSDTTLVTDLKGELRNDLYRWQKALSLPHWIAKQYPKFTALYDRQLARVDERLTKVHDAMESAQSFYDLPKTSLEEARKVIWALDGQKVEGLGAWSRSDGKFENGRTRLALEDAHYIALERHIKDELEASGKVAKAVADVRRSLDQGWVDLYNKFASKKEAADSEIANLRSQMGKIHNYFPHKRYGDFYIRAVDQEGTTVYREHFDMLFGSTEEKRRVGQERLKRRAQEMVTKLSERFPGYSWEYGDTAKLPEAVYEFPIPVDALQQIVNAGTDKLPEGSRKDVKNALDQAFADVLKERGFGSSFIQRQNVPGHEMKDVRRVFHDHLTGLYGFLTKMDAARDFTRAMRDIDARREPRLYEYAQRYMQDMLQNAGKVDQTVAALKAIGFVKYLGLRLPTAAINLTQNIISGIPVLSMHTKSAASRYFWTTAKDLLTFARYAMTGRLDKAKGLTPDEAAFLREAYASGHTQAAFVEDMQLRVADSARAKAMQKIMQVAGWPMAVTERFNRATLALAAYRAAREGKVINKQTLAKFDMSAGHPATHEQASAFARMVTDDAHFVYDKGNMPQPLRGTDMGKLASTSYQFRRFSHNMISLYAEMMRSDRGKQAMLRHIGVLVALGGLASVPLYRTMLAAIMHTTGDDGEELLRRMGVGDLVIYGLPSLAGLSFSGSMGMDIPVVSEMTDKQGNPIWDLLGIPGAFVRETQASAAALRSGRPDRALATSPLTPSIIRNAANAIRLDEEGARTLSGRPIPRPGDRQAMKLTKGQTWLKALGFQPMEMDKAWRVSESLEAQKEFVQEAKSAFASRYVNALNAKDVAAARRVLKEVQEWNARALREKKRHMVIDLKAAVRSRMQPVRPPKQFRARAKEMVEGRQ